MSDPGKALDFLTAQQTSLLQDGAYTLTDPNTAGYTVPPFIQFPEGGLAFDEQGTIIVPAIGSTDIVLTFTVPDGYDGVIKRLSNNYNGGGFNNGSGDLIWRITIDYRPVKNYSNIITELGTLQIPRATDGIRIFSNQVVSYTITHVANIGLPESSTCTLAGWYYPRGGE